jgi:hypothetical protein
MYFDNAGGSSGGIGGRVAHDNKAKTAKEAIIVNQHLLFFIS